jgi:hypothetical protein
MRRPVKIGVGVAASAALFAVAGLGIASMIEKRFIFYPDSAYVAPPEQYGLVAEDLWLDAADGGRVHGWFVAPVEGPPRAYVLFSHGNAGNISGRLPVAAQLVERGMAVLLYDYRGYGQSPGAPSEEGLYHDGEAALAELVRRAGDPSRVVLYGRSLGGGVSWELALRHPELAGIVSDCTFTSVPEMAARVIPLPMIGAFVRTRLANRDKVGRVTLPKLLFHGTDDELIPFTMGEELHAAARPPAEFVPLPGAGHNDTPFVDPELYFDRFEAFVERVVEDATTR